MDIDRYSSCKYCYKIGASPFEELARLVNSETIDQARLARFDASLSMPLVAMP